MSEAESQRKYTGIYFMLISAFSFALMGAITKLLGNSFSAIQLVFFRNIFGVIFIGITLLKRPLHQTGGKPLLLVFRGVIGTLALYAFFYNITHISLGEAVTYSQTSPIFIALFSYILLKEKLNIYGWLSIVIGFLGILCIFRPDASMDVESNIIGLFCGIGTAFAYLSIRELKKIYDTRAVVLSFMVSGIILPVFSFGLSFLFEPSSYDFIVSPFAIPHVQDWLWIILLGITSLTGQVFLTKAYGEEKAGIVSGIGYSNIVFSILLGVLLGDSLPGISAMIGIGLIISSGILISLTKKETQQTA
ncbi:DMT family transporter [Rhodocytophaga rosea]|uniref:DMT family transporter n=1 Tax=Rhodocytophaga rosea TaxID=2704465 RepID=A0A6C0GMZ1_9BACT|nr:DMT family transporter [Rhodocytophaga rosea]QHT69408.1 DMT family transporter [Rhodocytophaga rosea]